MTAQADEPVADENKPRPMRADAQRKMSSLLKAAMEVFSKSGVDAPVREIAEKAGVGLGTVYRHFPQRSDLIKAVFQSRVDACADAASELASQYEPGDALAHWMQRYVDFIATKRGLAAALHSGDSAYSALPGYFNTRLLPALKTLLDGAVRAGAVRSGVDAEDLLHAVANLCRVSHDKEPVYSRRMVALLVDGLRYGVTREPIALQATLASLNSRISHRREFASQTQNAWFNSRLIQALTEAIHQVLERGARCLRESL